MRAGFLTHRRQFRLLTLWLLLGLSSASDAEYLIYLKGGHFIVADDCTFPTRQGAEKSPGASEQTTPVEDCTEGRPNGPIFWSTINGHFGEVNADDVYAIFGTKSPQSIKRLSNTTDLEDYLITNRGESFVNAKIVEEKGVEIHGLKRDDLTKVNRRGVIEIAPERLAKSRSGEGLCPGESIDFAISEVELVEGHLLGAITNLSKEPWLPWIEVEVRVKGRFLGKFEIEDRNVLASGETISMDSATPGRFLKELAQLKNDEAGVRVCYRKVKKATKGLTAEKPSAAQFPK
ncbi:hypothetical protein [Candidatus Methylomirabilis sp.]|uniref:hypothetical protein n=1 Tax=Candidatus Methylomirabilis sp. TaxID=2032687 RepID=UPI002A5F38D1|nr:hypothetical protein [Candidatus Methylomirabilis sp.]